MDLHHFLIAEPVAILVLDPLRLISRHPVLFDGFVYLSATDGLVAVLVSELSGQSRRLHRSSEQYPLKLFEAVYA